MINTTYLTKKDEFDHGYKILDISIAEVLSIYLLIENMLFTMETVLRE